MAKPRVGDERMIVRAVEYLRRHPRWIAVYSWQKAPGGITVFTDSDWGGCTRTRRSTSGGVALHGSHCLLTWPRTQQLVALSSAEAELNASVKAAQEGMALKHLAEELGDKVWLCLKGDSSANDGIWKRSGAGKVKHLSVRQLWLQEKVGEGVLWHEKIPRAINVADAMTHYFTKPEALTHFPGMSCHRLSLQQSVGNTVSALPKGGFDNAVAVWGPMLQVGSGCFYSVFR